MGYFANGSEGMDYEAQFCERCIHGQSEDDDCAVWLAHLLKNYDECNNKNSILHVLIPRQPGGGNGQCRMFIAVPI